MTIQIKTGINGGRTFLSVRFGDPETSAISSTDGQECRPPRPARSQAFPQRELAALLATTVLCPRMNRLFTLLVLGVAALSLTGCAHNYITPGSKADLQAFAPADIQESFAIKPTHPFPAAIAVVRVQAAGYNNYHLNERGGRHGSGRYSVILTREVETDAHFARIQALPQVSGVTTLNRLLLPDRLESDRELRAAAARLQADLVFIYTFDTAFFGSDASKPLSVISLGLSPTRKITAVTTASALLVDTRTGYIYATYEATEREAARSTSWGSREAADEVRRGTEAQAFDEIVGEFAASWSRLTAR